MAILWIGNSYSVDMDQMDLGSLTTGFQVSATSTLYGVNVSGETTYFEGTGFKYNSAGIPIGGLVTHIQDQYGGQVVYDLTGFSVPATSFVTWAYAGDNQSPKLAILSGADTFYGGIGDDLLRSYGGNDSVTGGAGNDRLDAGDGDDTVNGGVGNDTIIDATGSNYLRGDDGNDSVSGGAGFDDINGNVGNDTAHGNGGNDWVVGGKDNDVLYGDAGDDIVYGNLGDDTINGGDGADLVRGGQGNDSVSGGAGNDLIYGDRGNDTISGGTGADEFHSFGDAGLDRIVDFNRGEGDRVVLDPGTTYTVAQSGSDVIVSMTGGAQMILVGVNLASLSDGWIVVG